QALAVEGEAQVSFPERLLGVPVTRPGALVPDPHVTRAVLALRDVTLEAAVLEPVILHLHGEALGRRIERGALGNRPAAQRPAELEAEIEVPRARVVQV